MEKTEGGTHKKGWNGVEHEIEGEGYREIVEYGMEERREGGNEMEGDREIVEYGMEARREDGT
jgi:hypothetical protein